ncbi:hypothetical protein CAUPRSCDRAFT_10539 [Caulochytrium protostelioides]|nr:hypothetical protein CAUPRSCDRAFT_10539 [Caulochytrium protostelioides]
MMRASRHPPISHGRAGPHRRVRRAAPPPAGPAAAAPPVRAARRYPARLHTRPLPDVPIDRDADTDTDPDTASDSDASADSIVVDRNDFMEDEPSHRQPPTPSRLWTQDAVMARHDARVARLRTVDADHACAAAFVIAQRTILRPPKPLPELSGLSPMLPMPPPTPPHRTADPSRELLLKETPSRVYGGGDSVADRRPATARAPARRRAAATLPRHIIRQIARYRVDALLGDRDPYAAVAQGSRSHGAQYGSYCASTRPWAAGRDPWDDVASLSDAAVPADRRAAANFFLEQVALSDAASAVRATAARGAMRRRDALLAITSTDRRRLAQRVLAELAHVNQHWRHVLLPDLYRSPLFTQPHSFYAWMRAAQCHPVAAIEADANAGADANADANDPTLIEHDAMAPLAILRVLQFAGPRPWGFQERSLRAAAKQLAIHTGHVAVLSAHADMPAAVLASLVMPNVYTLDKLVINGVVHGHEVRLAAALSHVRLLAIRAVADGNLAHLLIGSLGTRLVAFHVPLMPCGVYAPLMDRLATHCPRLRHLHLNGVDMSEARAFSDAVRRDPRAFRHLRSFTAVQVAPDALAMVLRHARHLTTLSVSDVTQAPEVIRALARTLRRGHLTTFHLDEPMLTVENFLTILSCGYLHRLSPAPLPPERDVGAHRLVSLRVGGPLVALRSPWTHALYADAPFSRPPHGASPLWRPADTNTNTHLLVSLLPALASPCLRQLWLVNSSLTVSVPFLSLVFLIERAPSLDAVVLSKTAVRDFWDLDVRYELNELILQHRLFGRDPSRDQLPSREMVAWLLAGTVETPASRANGTEAGDGDGDETEGLEEEEIAEALQELSWMPDAIEPYETIDMLHLLLSDLVAHFPACDTLGTYRARYAAPPAAHDPPVYMRQAYIDLARPFDALPDSSSTAPIQILLGHMALVCRQASSDDINAWIESERLHTI